MEFIGVSFATMAPRKAHEGMSMRRELTMVNGFEWSGKALGARLQAKSLAGVRRRATRLQMDSFEGDNVALSH
jgi:hypothetical protein